MTKNTLRDKQTVIKSFFSNKEPLQHHKPGQVVEVNKYCQFCKQPF